MLRRHLVLLCAAMAVAGAFATSATAAPCIDCGGGGGGTYHATYTHTLNASTSTGTVTSNPTGILCPSDCTLDEAHTVTCDGPDGCPGDADMPWGTYTLTASGGPSGYSPSWTGCTSVSAGVCSVKLDADKTVSLTWIDTTAPSVSLAVTNTAGKVGPLAAVSATASDNAGVSHVDWFVGAAHETQVLSRTPAQGLAGSIDLSSLADGSNVTIWARATDVNGLQSGFVSHTVTLDKQVSMSASALPAFTNAATVPLTISTDSDATLQCALNGGAAAPCAGTYSPLTAGSPDGSYTYAVHATDNVGNTASLTRTFVLDRTPPAVAMTSAPAEGETTHLTALTFEFTATDANLDQVTCTLDGVAQPCASSDTLSGLADGAHTFTVTAIDKAGNTRSSTRDFTVDTSVPSLPATTPPTTTPTTPTVPAPLPAIGARLSFGVKHAAGRTVIRTLKLTHVPRGATITVACKGGGCPRKAARYTAKRAGTVNLTALVGRRLRRGAKLTITVELAGHTRQLFTPLSRASRAPRGT